MRNIIFLLITLFIASCTPQKTVSSSTSQNVTGVKQQGSKLYGKVVVKSQPTPDGRSEKPVLYFDITGVEYLIDFSRSKVARTEVQKYVYKDIDILGEIKTGAVGASDAINKEEQENLIRSGESSVVIFKILD